ncbi:unnamed protein product [Trichobilharzia regenti]|nr:unnamed protein product [Trichobilharzia regenti]
MQSTKQLRCYRYADDTLTVYHNETHESYLFRLFSDAHTNTEFIMEHINDGRFHFPEVTIQRLEDDIFHKSIYRKENWNGKYLRFNSFSPNA